MPKAIDLSDKTVLITGALGGIGEYVISALLEADAFVIMTDRTSEEEARPVIAQRDHDTARTAYLQMDVTDADAVDRTVGRAFEQWPGINVLLGHAGGTHIERFEESTAGSWDEILRFNLMGQVYVTRSVVSRWSTAGTDGHVIFTSSYVSRLPFAGISAYIAAKAGLDMFAKTLALEYADQGIRFNAVAPGNVAVGSSDLAYRTDPQYREAVDRMSPLGRRNSPEAVADAFVYLCSSMADEIDGHVLNVDAGVGLPKIG